MPGNFSVDARHCEFYLVEAAYFYIVLQHFFFFSGTQLFGNYLIFSGVAFKVCWQDCVVYYQKWILSLCCGEVLCVLYPVSYASWRYLVPLVGPAWLPTLDEFWAMLPLILWGSFSLGPSRVPHTHVLISIQLNSGLPSSSLQNSSCAALPSLLSDFWTRAVLIFLDSQLCLPNSGRLPGFSRIPSPCAMAWKLSRQKVRAISRTALVVSQLSGITAWWPRPWAHLPPALWLFQVGA